MYLSDSLTCKPSEDFSNLICTNDGNLESVFVEVVLKSRKNIVIGCVYKHPLMGIDLFNNQYLSPVLKSIEDEGKSLTLLGDFDLLTFDSKFLVPTKCCHQLIFQPESQIPPALLLTTSLFLRLILTFYLAISFYI